jgi:hypothetical protein
MIKKINLSGRHSEGGCAIFGLLQLHRCLKNPMLRLKRKFFAFSLNVSLFFSASELDGKILIPGDPAKDADVKLVNLQFQSTPSGRYLFTYTVQWNAPLRSRSTSAVDDLAQMNMLDRLPKKKPESRSRSRKKRDVDEVHTPFRCVPMSCVRPVPLVDTKLAKERLFWS